MLTLLQVIRQLYLDNPATGLLALRLRNERLMTCATYMELRSKQVVICPSFASNQEQAQHVLKVRIPFTVDLAG
jgi:hypothetical protein